ncbi:MAG: hypothetical protein AMJ81_07070 [Phycisphaerae bacterium SM23_33]|nr:MAG: hypothetical protein AMJ81_07070 [Phycisphaerae bacterium SM23_33]
MKTTRWAWYLLLAAIAGGCGAPAGTARVKPAATEPMEVAARTPARPGVTVARLSNGLTVIVAQNHDAPVVCVSAYVRAGGLYEGKYLGAGISHLCEHLVAEGAVHDHGPAGTAPEAKQTGSRVEEIGGQSNAYTSLAHTCYYIAAAASKTDACIDLVADWMARSQITDADFRREHDVVQRELEMGRDSPRRQLWYAHARNFYGTHPAAVPVIGYQAPLAGLTLADVRDYHRRMYVVQNMVFVVAGDVETDKVLEQARRAFAGLQPGLLPDLTLPEVSPIANTRRVVFAHKAATEAMQYVSFRTIPLIHEDLYALDVLSYVLTNGESSRLVRRLKREQRLVTDVDSSSWTPAWGRGQFSFSFRCRPEQADEAEKALLAELGKVLAEGVTAEELARAKRQKVADLVYEQQTVESQAALLASDYLSTGDVEFSRRYTQRIQAVTAEQVKAVAVKYFDFDAMAITRMLPPEAAAKASAAERRQQPPQTKFFKLPNGMRVILHSTSTAELVSMVLVTRGGLLLETPQTNGLGTLMTALSVKGAGQRSAEQIAEFFDGAGGSISGACGNNTFYWEATVLSDSFTQALPIFADVVLRPAYPEKELNIVRPVLAAQIRRIEEGWYGQLNKRFRKDFFGDSPLSMMSAGSAEVVSQASREAVAAYHGRYVKAGASVLAVYGSFDLAEAESQVRRLFGAMPTGDNAVATLGARGVAPGGETFVHPAKLKGAALIVAAPGMKVTDVQDNLAMAVLDTIISGYRLPSGWLHTELRGRGLVYVVHASNWAALTPGAFMAYAHCEPQNAALVARTIREKFRRTVSYPFSRREVDEAVNIIVTAELLENQSMMALAMQAALDELYGLGFDFRREYEKRLRAVTPAEVSRVAGKYLAGGYVTTVVTPEPKLFIQKGKPSQKE